ncbi:hypothetical protein P167DRAFT_47896 [Morchella conica CCBAS932]|uniref:Uncharacterized protein n=1 Tax=Morchella conica CCBAS932 TaxID=1392247 RepID=A0A3N4KWF6_9PEZI|nr:hypothetical protein P167DRAFT_47896 [Morchella conica CCBAS932]
MPKTFLPSKQVGLEHERIEDFGWVFVDNNDFSKDLRTLYMFHKFCHFRNHYSATSDSHLSPFFLSFFLFFFTCSVLRYRFCTYANWQILADLD